MTVMKETTTNSRFMKNAYTAIVLLLIVAFVGSSIYIGVSCFINH